MQLRLRQRSQLTQVTLALCMAVCCLRQIALLLVRIDPVLGVGTADRALVEALGTVGVPSGKHEATMIAGNLALLPRGEQVGRSRGNHGVGARIHEHREQHRGDTVGRCAYTV